MITPGKYSAWFKTLIGDGAGMVDLGADGELHGGDHTFAYEGTWSQEGKRFRADLSAKRVVRGPSAVFGMDELDIIIAGQSDGGTSVVCTGFAKQSPGLKLEVVLVRTETL